MRYILYTVRRVKYTNPKHVLDSFSRAHTWDRRLHRDTERPPTRAPHALPRSIPTGPPREPPFWPPSSTLASPVLELPVRGIVRRSLCVCLRSATTASPRLGHGAVRNSSSPRHVPSQRRLPPFRPWTLGLFLLFSYHERRCHGRPCAGPSVGARALFSSVSPAGGIPGARGRHVGPTTGVLLCTHQFFGEKETPGL